jgi:hypothetical protein
MEEKGIVSRSDRYSLFKSGGTIEIKQLGGQFDIERDMRNAREKELKARATAAGVSVEKQKAGERKTNSDAKDPGNLNAGFSDTDMVRLSSIGADVLSMIAAFLPGYGTVASGVLGVGSTLANFGADVAEDGLDWGDAGNLVAGLGMDVLGMIPHFGAGSKTAKIVKNVGKWVPRIVAALGTMATIKNAPQIISSFNKLTTDFKNMTVNDWRNIA